MPAKHTIRHKGNPQETLSKGLPLWARGDKVTIDADGHLLDYFDFLLVTRRHDDEAILAMIAMFETRRELKKDYTKKILRLVRRLEAATNRGRLNIRQRFRKLRLGIVEPFSEWVAPKRGWR